MCVEWVVGEVGSVCGLGGRVDWVVGEVGSGCGVGGRSNFPIYMSVCVYICDLIV